MKKYFKNAMLLLLTAIFLFSFAACGSGKNGNGPGNGSSSMNVFRVGIEESQDEHAMMTSLTLRRQTRM